LDQRHGHRSGLPKNRMRDGRRPRLALGGGRLPDQPLDSVQRPPSVSAGCCDLARWLAARNATEENMNGVT
jgi:hypothetical protein